MTSDAGKKMTDQGKGKHAVRKGEESTAQRNERLNRLRRLAAKGVEGHSVGTRPTAHPHTEG